MTKISTKKSPSGGENASPDIQVIKLAKCKSLSGKSALSYQLGHNHQNELFIRIVGNNGGGFFGQDWVAYEDIINQFEACPEQITSMSLQGLFHRKSANTQGFILAALVAEGVIAPSKEKQRAYTLQDTEPFFKAMEQLRTDAEQGKSKPAPRRKQHPPSRKKAATSPDDPVTPDEN